MGHSQAEKSATHARIVNVAAKRFREVGLDGIGVSDVMKEAGLTVGGFYKHFENRDALVIEALAEAFKDPNTVEYHATSIGGMIRRYLSEAHRDTPGTGCAMAALLGDVSRSSDGVRAVYIERVRNTIAFTDRLLAIDDPVERRAKALLVLSSCVGALGLARAVAGTPLSAEILQSVSAQLLALVPASETPEMAPAENVQAEAPSPAA